MRSDKKHAIRWAREQMETDFIVLDTETTGVDTYKDENDPPGGPGDGRSRQGGIVTTKQIIRIDPPLPCGILKGINDHGLPVNCGRPATVAHVTPVPPGLHDFLRPGPGQARPGEWILLPVCDECSAALAYTHAPHERKEEIQALLARVRTKLDARTVN